MHCFGGSIENIFFQQIPFIGDDLPVVTHPRAMAVYSETAVSAETFPIALDPKGCRAHVGVIEVQLSWTGGRLQVGVLTRTFFSRSFFPGLGLCTKKHLFGPLQPPVPTGSNNRRERAHLCTVWELPKEMVVPVRSQISARRWKHGEGGSGGKWCHLCVKCDLM